MDDRTSPRGADADRDQDSAYTLTLYSAAPGTPVRQDDGSIHRSLPGHVYYSISDGRQQHGFGFSPIEPGQAFGPGHVVRNEFQRYQQPVYARTMEITREQYDKLLDYGMRGVNGDASLFNPYYKGTTNSCIDFVWKGLEHAGIHRSPSLPLPGKLGYADPKGYDGALKPTHNIEDFERLQAPVPDSPHNRVERHPMPEDRTLLQRLLSDRGSPDDPAHPDHGLLENLRGEVRSLDRQAGKPWDDASERLAASALVMAKEKGFTAEDDLQLAFNRPTERYAGGEILHLSRQGPNASHDPAGNRAHMPTADALSQPAEERFQQAEVMGQAQEQAMQLAQQQAIGADDPTRGGPIMRA